MSSERATFSETLIPLVRESWFCVELVDAVRDAARGHGLLDEMLVWSSVLRELATSVEVASSADRETILKGARSRKTAPARALAVRAIRRIAERVAAREAEFNIFYPPSQVIRYATVLGIQTSEVPAALELLPRLPASEAALARHLANRSGPSYGKIKEFAATAGISADAARKRLQRLRLELRRLLNSPK